MKNTKSWATVVKLEYYNFLHNLKMIPGLIHVLTSVLDEGKGGVSITRQHQVLDQLKLLIDTLPLKLSGTLTNCVS